MLSRISNTILLAAFIFSIIYGITIIGKKEAKPIFVVSLIALITLFISRLFFLVLNLSSGNEEIFSVGVLGQVAGYLFLVMANKTYLPFDSRKNKFDVRAIFIMLIPLICYGLSIVTSQSLSSIICSVLYFCSVCPALYFAFNNLLLIRTDERFKQLKWFNVCIVAITIISSLENIIIYINNSTILVISTIILEIICFIAISACLPLLNNGVNKHDC